MNITMLEPDHVPYSHTRSTSPATMPGQVTMRHVADDISRPTIFVVDDNADICNQMQDLLEEQGYRVECFCDGAAFLKSYGSGHAVGCLLIDAVMPQMGGIEVIEFMKHHSLDLPTIVMSGHPAVQMAVCAMKAGAVDYIEKPVSCEDLLQAVKSAVNPAGSHLAKTDFRKVAAQRIATLTARQHEILDLVVAGHPSKNIAADLQISQRTVDNHRAAIARRTCSKSLPELIQTALCAKCTVDASAKPQAPTLAAAPPTGRGDIVH